MHRTALFCWGGGGGRERKVSVVKVFRQQQIRPNLIRHYFNGSEKEPLELWNFTSILSLGPLRRIHFLFAKYSSFLIQCRGPGFLVVFGFCSSPPPPSSPVNKLEQRYTEKTEKGRERAKRMPFGPQKLRFTGPTPYNGLSNKFDPIKIIKAKS